MDRIDAMKVFVAALDGGSPLGGASKLGRSPTAVSRAAAFLEDQVACSFSIEQPLNQLNEAGARYVACPRVLTRSRRPIS